eukprot:gene2684-12917_t
MQIAAILCASLLILLSSPFTLAQHGADSLLGVYAERNDVERMQVALKDGADVNKRGSQKRTPLMSATLGGSVDAVKLLLEQPGVDTTIPEKDGYTPMHGAGFQ